MSEKRIYTKEGFDALQSELAFMKAEREKNKKEISEARSYGDLSENSEYDEAKNNQAKIAIRIDELEEMIKNAIVQDEGEIDYSKVSVGSIVEVQEAGKEPVVLKIVGSYEADPFATPKLISDESPLGMALRGRGAGETVTVVTPKGTERVYAILDVSRS